MSSCKACNYRLLKSSLRMQSNTMNPAAELLRSLLLQLNLRIMVAMLQIVAPESSLQLAPPSIAQLIECLPKTRQLRAGKRLLLKQFVRCFERAKLPVELPATAAPGSHPNSHALRLHLHMQLTTSHPLSVPVSSISYH